MSRPIPRPAPVTNAIFLSGIARGILSSHEGRGNRRRKPMPARLAPCLKPQRGFDRVNKKKNAKPGLGLASISNSNLAATIFGASVGHTMAREPAELTISAPARSTLSHLSIATSWSRIIAAALVAGALAWWPLAAHAGDDSAA